MLLTGEVEKIIFRNADNGYTVLDIHSSGDYITAVGIFPELYEGARVEINGDYKHNSRHGLQFLAESVKVLQPNSSSDIEKFLKSGLFFGIGEVTAKNIVAHFGDATLDIIKNTPMRLTEVKGISKNKAETIKQVLTEHSDMQNALLFLQKFDMSLNMALKIYKVYGTRTEEVVRENPYQLISDVERVGFTTADKIAGAVGIDKDSDFRVKAGIIYTLKESMAKNGHTALPEDILFKDVIKLLGFDDTRYEKVQSNIDDLIFLSELKECVYDNARFIMLYQNYLTEKSIAKNLIKIESQHKAPLVDFSEQISVFEDIFKIKLHEKQREAVNNSLNSGVHVITGGPGTGKTTIIKCILHILKSLKLTYRLCAPTGRAAKRMSEATGEEASTIHRLLDLDFKNGKGFFTFNENTKIPADVIICDEVSMVDEYVFSSLIKAISDGASIILVGDKDQLASVGAGNVLSDIMQSGFFKVTYLDKIYRQSDGSMIIDNAHAINSGKMPVLDNHAKDFFFVNQGGKESNPDEVLSLVSERLPKFLGCNSSDIQVLCPMKKGPQGVINLNKLLRDKLNKTPPSANDITSGEYVFRVGDKVMQTVNNYEQEWLCFEDNGNVKSNHSGRGVFNGDMGYLIDINKQKMTFTIRFDDDKVAVYSLSDIDQLIPAYAISVHKSQGSEFKCVVVCLERGNFFIMTRNLLYTAVTRAKDMVVIVGDEDVIRRMVKNNYTAKRYTLLINFLKEALL